MLDQFISYAADATPNTSAGIINLVIILVVWGGIFYFLLIRPNKKREKQHREMLSSLKTGDVVITTGGIKGEIVAITDEFIELRVDKGVKISFKKSVIANVYKSK
ncbi:protein translocase subunit yajC [Hypnocyclicus thermotrophus]|uniref:Protein translocase subunit yajC n=1 Tax=Hypnocyclicus thermotrophus TaxID=1627895 RepID=A0AA46I5I0_9FUSO|nr:preprotein translocase subunit YajC [Hypnocyclicus thermotrophus]TDT70506.1 protein translocase subunit yajC [Hypnocyclicus thermotrophus]